MNTCLFRVTARAGAAALLTLAVQADVLTVNPNGTGDYTTVSAAVGAALDGDVLLVAPGTYGGFFTSKSLTVIGGTGVTIGSTIVSDLSATQDFAVVDVNFSEVWFDGCAGTVLLDNLVVDMGAVSAPLLVTDCSDVRVHRTQLPGLAIQLNDVAEGVLIADSRVELVGTTLSGEVGEDPNFSSNPMGAPGARADRSKVHFAQCNVSGGNGAAGSDCGSHPPGWGGPGIQALDTELIVSANGSANVTGGSSGASSGPCGGNGGSGIEVNGTSSLRHGGVTITGGLNTPTGSASAITGPGSVSLVAELDPTLELLDTPLPGGTVRLRITGEPGSSLVLHSGNSARLLADPASSIEQLTSENHSTNLGVLDATGAMLLTLNVPPHARPGRTLWLQVSTTTPVGADLERSNSAALLVRP